jgi:hypothetical protein
MARMMVERVVSPWNMRRQAGHKRRRELSSNSLDIDDS